MSFGIGQMRPHGFYLPTGWGPQAPFSPPSTPLLPPSSGSLPIVNLSPTNPAGGVFNPDSLACQILSAAGIPCNATGLIDAAKAGYLRLTGSGGSDCPGGAIKVGTKCVSPADLLPGGDPLISGASGTAVMGGFGIPAMVPMIVGEMANGSPIRRCIAGAVLGKDDLCYMKGSIPRTFRKWAPQKKAPVTAADAACIRRAAAATKRVATLAKSVGLKVNKR